MLLAAGLVNQHRHGSSANQSTAQELQIAQELPVSSGAPQAPAAKPNPEREEWRDERDLEAQQNMARWAEFLFYATVVGVVLLAATLFETRAAAKAAWDMVKKAKEATELTKDTARRELRAYVLVESTKVTFDNGKRAIDYWIQLKNFGQTPAYGLKASFTATFFQGGKIKFLGFQPKRVETLTRADLGGSAPFSVRERITLSDEAIFEAILHEKIRMVVGGHVEYRDVFGQTQTLDFRGIAANLLAHGWVLAPAEDGNKAS